MSRGLILDLHPWILTPYVLIIDWGVKSFSLSYYLFFFRKKIRHSVIFLYNILICKDIAW